MTNDLIVPAYSDLAPFYRQVLGARSHFAAQVAALSGLLEREGHGRTQRILDAACGSGDVLAALADEQYTDLWGIDACEAMLCLAEPRFAESGRLEPCQWEHLPSFFERRGTFDMIYILGHALPHANANDIPGIIRAAFGGLRNGGLFVFDMRDWSCDALQNLVQEGRSTTSSRPLGRFEVDGRHFDVDDICSYKDKHEGRRQHITYRFRRVNTDGMGWDDQKEIDLSYAIFDSHTAETWMVQAGFKNVRLEKPESYPYRLVSGLRGNA